MGALAATSFDAWPALGGASMAPRQFSPPTMFSAAGWQARDLFYLPKLYWKLIEITVWFFGCLIGHKSTQEEFN